MALFTMKLENLEQLFLQELRDLYDAEDQITEALPKMIEAAHYPAQECPAGSPECHPQAD